MTIHLTGADAADTADNGASKLADEPKHNFHHVIPACPQCASVGQLGPAGVMHQKLGGGLLLGARGCNVCGWVGDRDMTRRALQVPVSILRAAPGQATAQFRAMPVDGKPLFLPGQQNQNGQPGGKAIAPSAMLAATMSWVSQQCWGRPWHGSHPGDFAAGEDSAAHPALSATEFALWGIVAMGGVRSWGGGDLSELIVNTLKNLANQAVGWCAWLEPDEGAVKLGAVAGVYFIPGGIWQQWMSPRPASQQPQQQQQQPPRMPPPRTDPHGRPAPPTGWYGYETPKNNGSRTPR